MTIGDESFNICPTCNNGRQVDTGYEINGGRVIKPCPTCGGRGEMLDEKYQGEERKGVVCADCALLDWTQMSQLEGSILYRCGRANNSHNAYFHPMSTEAQTCRTFSDRRCEPCRARCSGKKSRENVWRRKMNRTNHDNEISVPAAWAALEVGWRLRYGELTPQDKLFLAEICSVYAALGTYKKNHAMRIVRLAKREER